MNLQGIGDGFSLPSTIRGFPQNHLQQLQQQPPPSNPNPKVLSHNNGNPLPSKKKRNLPGTPGNLSLFQFVNLP